MTSRTSLETVDYAALEATLSTDAAAYAAGVPFPHIVLDDVLLPAVFSAAAGEFPRRDDPLWKGYLHVNETKYSNTRPDFWGPTLQSVARELCSDRFVAYLTALTGIEALLPDWSMDGGGLHQTLRGGHLNIHADFSTHHKTTNWSRRVNVLLYLNEYWDDSWGGDLELWPQDMSARTRSVTPAPNRMLVFTTSETSFHGHPDPLLVPEGHARRSMALYYFTVEDEVVRRATNYQPRPGDGLKGIAIRADRRALDLYDRAKVRLGIDDERIHSVLRRVHRIRRGRQP